MTKEITYFTKALLVRANNAAIKTNRNRTLYPDKVKALPNLNFPVAFSFIHNDVEVRVGVYIGPDVGHMGLALLDIPFETFNALPKMTINREGD